MMKSLKILLVITALPVLCRADVRLPNLVSDGMVLQRDKKVHLWGWAAPGEEVSVTFNKQLVKGKTEANGRWDVYLHPIPAGGPYKLQVKGNNSITVNNVLVGDVWLCSGQSNMEYQVYKSAINFPDDISHAGDYNIREFAVKNSYKMQPQQNAVGSWVQANPETVLKFSAVGYFFAQSLYKTYKVPIGIIHSSYPGSPAEAWVSDEELKDFPQYLEKARPFKDSAYTQSVLKHDRTITAQWMAEVKKNDAGLQKGRALWSHQPGAEGWKPMQVPGYWEDSGAPNVDGVVWLKKNVNVPKNMLSKPVFLEIGLIGDIDSTYINGALIGSKDNKYLVRRYEVLPGVLKEGENTIVIRIINRENKGGIISGKQYRLINDKGAIDLSGQWDYKIGYASAPIPSKTFTRVEFTPTIQYNSRIVPLIGYTIKGAAWYQGESNTSKAPEYQALLTTLIKDWRTRWQQGDFPFLIVQLANHMQPAAQPKGSGLAMLREAQFKTSRAVQASGMVVTIDVGEAYDVHPYNKKTVGERLALKARQVAYLDTKVIASGPVYRSMQTQGNKITLTFESSASALTAKNGDLKQFAIAGADKVFRWAEAKIENGKIVVWADDVPQPVAVRYAWGDNPVGCNLYNAAGLPASPFRTDSWDN